MDVVATRIGEESLAVGTEALVAYSKQEEVAEA
jgi:hypothetical protein